MKAFNLATGAEMIFDPYCSAFYAVAYAYNVETKNNASRFFQSCQDHDKWWIENTPFVEGEKTVAAGDWCAIKE